MRVRLSWRTSARSRPWAVRSVCGRLLRVAVRGNRAHGGVLCYCGVGCLSSVSAYVV